MSTEFRTAQINLPEWMYCQIISDDTAKTVWCYCGMEAISYCNGLQFVCRGGHFGVPMKALKPRDEQVWFEDVCRKARELRREQAEAAEAKASRRRRNPASEGGRSRLNRLTQGGDRIGG